MTVRLAIPADEEPLYGLLLELERDNNSFGIVLDEERIREHIRLGTERKGALIGVVDARDPDDPVKLAGSVGIFTDRFWCDKNYHWAILWLFVRSDYRKGYPFAEDLMNWARRQRKLFEEALGKPVVLLDSPFSRNDLPIKIRWWRRYGEQIGAVFLIKR